MVNLLRVRKTALSAEGGLNTQSPQYMLSLCSLRSHNTTLVRLAARSRFARLLCSLRSPPRSTPLTCALASLACLPPRLLASLALPAARFARPAFPAARSAHPLSCCPPSLRSGRFSCLLAPLAASPTVLSLRSSARLLLAPLAASTAARFARRWLLRLLLALRSPSTCQNCSPVSLALPASPAQHFTVHSLDGQVRVPGS